MSLVRTRLFFVLLSLSLVLSAYLYLREPKLYLTFEMAASGASQAQLFYDTGSGFLEAGSATLPVESQSLASFESLRFALPLKTVYNLRFDPLANQGQVSIRNLVVRSRGLAIQRIAISKVIPLNQIASVTAGKSQADFRTTPGAIDPQLRIVLDKPLDLPRLLRKQRVYLLAIVNACLAAVFVAFVLLERPLLSLLKNARKIVRGIDRRFALIGRRVSGDFITLDSLAVWVYAGLVVFFLIASALDLNGSSEGVFSEWYHRGPAVKTFLGEPLVWRSDEWAYETPAMLNQYFRADRFAAQDSAFGNHFIGLTGNIPVKQVTTLFRPQFWPFFVLRLDYAYAMFWQAKGLILVAGVFTFLLWITTSSLWALSGALWYFFSAFTQWSYSWPSSLPEMLGLVCLGTFSFCYLTVGSLGWRQLAAAVCSVICAVDFAMCAYVPHMLPLLWFALAMLAAWCAAQSKLIFRSQGRWLRVSVILLAMVVVAGVGFQVYVTLKPAILALAATSYPGHRLAPGGTMPLWEFGSHFMQWRETESNFPVMLGNVCEASGFLWLAPVTLFCLPRLALSRFQKYALVALWACGLLLFCWDVLPLPAWFGRITALDLCPAARTLPALGLINIAIVALTAARFRSKPLPAGNSSGTLHAVYFLAAFLVLYVTLHATDAKMNGYFGHWEVIATAAFVAWLSVLLLVGRSRALAAGLLIPHILAFGAVNPVERGLPVFTDSALHRFVQTHRQLLVGKWIVYSGSVVNSGFLSATGCSVYTSLRYMPDVDHFALFAKWGADLNVINRLAYVVAQPVTAAQKGGFSVAQNGIITWKVAANDPILRQLGIRYIAFDSKPAASLTDGLAPLTDAPVDGFWLYQRNDS